MKTAFIKAALLVLAIELLVSACTGKQNEAFSTESATLTGKETRAPGDFTLESIINGAERHMELAGFVEIAADELKQLYPNITALPVELRGRRAGDGTEYLVLASSDDKDITFIKDVNQVLEKDAAQRAKELQMDYSVTAGCANKYGAVVFTKGDANELIQILLRTFSGEYIFN